MIKFLCFWLEILSEEKGIMFFMPPNKTVVPGPGQIKLLKIHLILLEYGWHLIVPKVPHMYL